LHVGKHSRWRTGETRTMQRGGLLRQAGGFTFQNCAWRRGVSAKPVAVSGISCFAEGCAGMLYMQKYRACPIHGRLARRSLMADTND
jgi:hypothetical protein